MANKFKSEALLERLLSIRDNPRKKALKISHQQITALCSLAESTFLSQPSLLKIPAPVKICGDIHGQYFDLLNLFDVGGQPPRTRYLFLGDYVDRGKNSLETICLLLSLKVAYPNSFFMIRGNHECDRINRKYGFYSEIRRRFKKNFEEIYNRINLCFNHLPLAAIVNGQIYCCHGGLGPNLITVSQIERLKRPMTIPGSGWENDTIWSDPTDHIDGWEKQNHPASNHRHRGAGWLFGKNTVAKFLKTNKLKMIVRAHQCVPEGYKWFFKGQLVTVFSAPNYSNKRNTAAIMNVRKGGSVGFQRFN